VGDVREHRRQADAVGRSDRAHTLDRVDASLSDPRVLHNDVIETRSVRRIRE
jgi:hypothetical protein